MIIDTDAVAVVGDRLLTGLADVTDDLAALDSTGFWAVVLPFDDAPVRAGHDGSPGPHVAWAVVAVSASGAGRRRSTRPDSKPGAMPSGKRSPRATCTR